MTLLLGVLAASLLGSVHCAAMCGGFVCLYAGTGAGRPRGFDAHVAYNAGRLVSYVTLGLIAGALGANVNQLGRLAGIERGAMIVAGTLMLMWASAVIAASFGIRFSRVGTGAPTWIKQRLGAVLVALRDRPASVRAGALGLVTTLLPCGWLYTFVVTAGGTGSAVAGAAVMFAFWAGTVPMLLAVGLGAQRVARPIARHLPLASAILVLALGMLSIAGKLRPLLATGAATTHSHGPAVDVAR